MRSQHKNSEFHLSSRELRRLVAAAQSRRNRLLIQLLAFTGLRRAEARALTRDDVDLRRSRLLIRNGKGGKQRIVFLSTELKRALREYCRDLESRYLFPGANSGPMSLRNINYIVARIGSRAGVENPNPRHENVTPHLLRHSFARNWKKAGGSMESLQKILGHSSLRTTMDVYGTETLKDTERNYRQLESLLVAPISQF